MTEPSQGEPEPASEGDGSEPTAAQDEVAGTGDAADVGDFGDVEGPRRRARREREERRTAQERATAIEEARREAKRRALGETVQETKTLGRGAVRGLKLLMWTALIAVLVVGLGLLLYFTPLMSTRSVAVTGLSAVAEDEVVVAAAVVPGLRCCRSTPMRLPSGSPRFGASPRSACSASIRLRCGLPSSSESPSWSGTIRTGCTCSTVTGSTSLPRHRRRGCRIWTLRTRVPPIQRPWRRYR